LKSFEETLVTSTGDWVSTGLITEAQRAAILARHPVAEGGGSRFVAILATVGGLLLAVGISLLVKSNWKDLSDWTKIGGLVVLMLAAYGAGWRLKMSRGTYPKVGDALLMVGSLLFLTGIALVSQIFHLNSRPATGVMVWWLGIAAVPWLTHAKGAQFVSLVALLTWLGVEMNTTGSWIHVGRRNEVWFLAVFFLLGVAIWMFGLALRGTRKSEFAGLHEKWGFIVTAGTLYWLGFVRHFWRWAQPGGWERPGALVLFAAVAAALGILAWRASRREVKALLPWVVLALVPVAGVVGGYELNDGGWLWSGAAWISLFALSIAAIRIGIDTGREGWVNLGVVFIALNIVTRYFDLFGTMLEGGLFFILMGVLVIALGIFLEKKRRLLLARLRRTEAGS
jgi:uncharacterized membrane protein